MAVGARLLCCCCDTHIHTSNHCHQWQLCAIDRCTTNASATDRCYCSLFPACPAITHLPLHPCCAFVAAQVSASCATCCLASCTTSCCAIGKHSFSSGSGRSRRSSRLLLLTAAATACPQHRSPTTLLHHQQQQQQQWRSRQQVQAITAA